MTIKQALAVLALGAIATTTVRAQPVEQPAELYIDGGRFFRVVLANGISWDDAQAYANASSHEGVQGHLATINSPEEDMFVFGLTIGKGEMWIGGGQAACTPTPSADCGWAWRNVSGLDVGEPINATNTSAPFSLTNPYTNWQAGEPNDHLGVDEKNLAIGLGGNQGWNDEGHLSNIRGFIIEYGDQLAPFPATQCLTSEGCNLTGGNVNGALLRLPSTAQSVSGDVEVRTWVVPVPAGRCVAGQDADPLELDLVGLNGEGGPDGDDDVIVPGYLCTHPANPQLLVIKSHSDVEIPSGVVSITNDTTKLLNPAYDCNAPIPPLAGGPFGREDPLTQDVVVFQYDDLNVMLENGFNSLRDSSKGEFDGSVIESTNGCINPSRGSGGRGSYILVGLSIHQGSAASSRARLIALVQHKFDVLGKGLDQAKIDRALKNGDYSKLKSEVNAATGDLTNGNFNEAYKHVQNFKKFLNSASIKTDVTDRNGDLKNWNGEFRMRIDNIAFTLQVKVRLLSPP
jgi:hypothetical protein